MNVVRHTVPPKSIRPFGTVTVQRKAHACSLCDERLKERGWVPEVLSTATFCEKCFAAYDAKRVLTEAGLEAFYLSNPLKLPHGNESVKTIDALKSLAVRVGLKVEKKLEDRGFEITLRVGNDAFSRGLLQGLVWKQ